MFLRHSLSPAFGGDSRRDYAARSATIHPTSVLSYARHAQTVESPVVTGDLNAARGIALMSLLGAPAWALLLGAIWWLG